MDLEVGLGEIVAAAVGTCVGLIPFLRAWWAQKRADTKQYLKGRQDEARWGADYYRKIIDERDERHESDLERYRQQIERDQQADTAMRAKLDRLEEIQEQKTAKMAEVMAELTQVRAENAQLKIRLEEWTHKNASAS